MLGFLAARWRRAESLDSLDEWGLGGRGFGTFISWFLIGGDIYTAYTFIAVPATLYAGSVVGFFAVPYTIVLYPIIFIFLPRFWSVSHRHGYVTPADFVRGRFDSKPLALAVAVTGLLATMPYIALQLVGIQVVLEVMGIGGGDELVVPGEGPAAVHRVRGAGGLHLRLGAARAGADRVRQGHPDLHRDHRRGDLPADPARRLGRHLRAAPRTRSTSFNNDNADAIAAGDGRRPRASSRRPRPHWAYASLALGSALALFMYPHSLTGVLASKNRSVIRRNAALLPAYSFLLGLLALLGFAAIAAGVKVDNPQQSVPALFDKMFPGWFAGRRVRGHRDRRPGAGGDHVDRGGEPVDPQHLQGVHQPRRDAEAGGHGRASWSRWW